jgi:hypothetical protein
LLRFQFFHPFVVLNARLWNLKEDQLEEVSSVRLYISTIENQHAYVDIVSEAAAERYIGSMISHFTASSRRSISKLWRMIEEINWTPGQEEASLDEAFGLAQAQGHGIVSKPH